MNIFKILSSYNGSIKEPNISSFLAYLLDLNEDHGLSDLLLKNIILDFQNQNHR
ncbi:MAG: PD-(D/E)XK nuclease family protein [Treponema sp.]|nr:PD-(D/E)XK nuclease family protein [Treponema sp.]MBR0476120.1 PD-(D/E)XK nuclease family protein [Treponema sp.]